MFYFVASRLKQAAERKAELNNSNFFNRIISFYESINSYHFLKGIIVYSNEYSININNNVSANIIAITITIFFISLNISSIHIKINKNKISIIYDQIFIYFDFQIFELKIVFFFDLQKKILRKI